MKAKLKVLLVDDSPVIIARLKNMLNELDSVMVLGEARNGYEAFSFLKIVLPDVVILDVTMPEKSGINVLTEIKHKYPDIKVIMLTNQANLFTRNLCISLGANYFFDKSTEFEKIPAVLKTFESHEVDVPLLRRGTC